METVDSIREQIKTYVPTITGIDYMSKNDRYEIIVVWRKNINKVLSGLYNQLLMNKISKEEFDEGVSEIKQLLVFQQ